MHEFKYIGNRLFCETVDISNISREVSTPFYLYSRKTLIDHFLKLEDAFRELKPLICFSMKANSNLSICRELVKRGAGLDVVSGGELYKVLKIGAKPEKIVYSGVGKTQKEISYAIKNRILLFNVESIDELELINKLSKRFGVKTSVSIRINPDIEPATHKYVTTGKLENKFGVDLATARELFLRRYSFKNLRICGVHLHIGSQITKARPFVEAIKKVLPLIKELKKKNVRLKYLNIGGGLGIIYRDEKPQTAAEFAKQMLPLLTKLDLKIILEPGRFIAGNSGILVTKVLYIKLTPKKRFVIVDAGMNDLIRPSLYGAYHEILPLIKKDDVKFLKYDVVGPICESGDFFAKDRKMPEVLHEELLAIMGAGAYGFSMASNYNSRPRPAEVMVNGGTFHIIRKRERYSDLITGEIWKN